jgi:3-methyladenine DNA glycosylase AlkC
MKRDRIEENCYRIRVPWGWIVEVYQDVFTPMYTGYEQPEMKTGYEWRVSITFVFDPFHWWKIDK